MFFLARLCLYNQNEKWTGKINSPPTPRWDYFSASFLSNLIYHRAKEIFATENETVQESAKAESMADFSSTTGLYWFELLISLKEDSDIHATTKINLHHLTISESAVYSSEVR